MMIRSILMLSVLLGSAIAQKPEAATGFVATHQALLDARNDIGAATQARDAHRHGLFDLWRWWPKCD